MGDSILTEIIAAITGGLFWNFIYRIYYGSYYKEINYNINQKSPGSTLHSLSNVIFTVFAFYYHDELVMNNMHRLIICWNTISYEVTELMYYQHGKTHISWVIHHTLTIIAFIPLVLSPVFYVQPKIYFCYELGSNLFMLQLGYKTIKDDLMVSVFFVIIYWITRGVICYQLCIFWGLMQESESEIDYVSNSVYFWMNVLILPLNGWYGYKSIKRLYKKFSQRQHINSNPYTFLKLIRNFA